jgi:5-formyltetrahydrofolate cyclo-ligase
MFFAFVDDPDRMEERGFGFREPPETAEHATALDVVVVPALAVAPDGHRLGYGAGYYDRTLPSYCPPGISVAVAFDYQLLAEVPVTPGDVAVHRVITDLRDFSSSS